METGGAPRRLVACVQDRWENGYLQNVSLLGCESSTEPWNGPNRQTLASLGSLAGEPRGIVDSGGEPKRAP